MPDWAECSLLRTVLRESREEPLKGHLSNLVVDFSSPFLLQDCVAVHPEGVVDTAHAKTLAWGEQILSADPGTAGHGCAQLE